MTINLYNVFDGYEVYHQPAERIKKICGCSLYTAKRWLKSRQFPLWAIKLLCLYDGHFVWDEWLGWRIGADNRLYHPDLKYGFTAGQVAHLHYLQQRCDHLERLNRAPAQYLLDV